MALLVSKLPVFSVGPVISAYLTILKKKKKETKTKQNKTNKQKKKAKHTGYDLSM